MNTREAPRKFGIMDRNINNAVICVFCAQLLLISICVVSLYSLGYNRKDDFPYIFTGTSDEQESVLPTWLELFLVFFLLFCNVIPISLHVTLVMVQVAQAFLLASDVDMYDPDHESGPVVKNSNLLQEFGNVTNVFSDKTGTLTKNEMRLVCFSVDGRTYKIGDPVSAAEVEGNYKLSQMLKCVATCHTLLRDSAGRLQAESPDELALVEVGACASNKPNPYPCPNPNPNPNPNIILFFKTPGC